MRFRGSPPRAKEIKIGGGGSDPQNPPLGPSIQGTDSDISDQCSVLKD